MNRLTHGGLYALVALGYSMVYGVLMGLSPAIVQQNFGIIKEVHEDPKRAYPGR